MNQISDRLRGLVQSDIRRMSRECERVGGINLGQGICDLPTIPELVEGACDAIRANTMTWVPGRNDVRVWGWNQVAPATAPQN